MKTLQLQANYRKSNKKTVQIYQSPIFYGKKLSINHYRNQLYLYEESAQLENLKL